MGKIVGEIVPGTGLKFLEWSGFNSPGPLTLSSFKILYNVT